MCWCPSDWEYHNKVCVRTNKNTGTSNNNRKHKKLCLTVFMVANDTSMDEKKKNMSMFY